MSDSLSMEEVRAWLEAAPADSTAEYYNFGADSFDGDYWELDEEHMARLGEFEEGVFTLEDIISSSGIYLYTFVLHHRPTDTWWRRALILHSQDWEWSDRGADPWDSAWVQVLPTEETVLVFNTVA